jgi:hypothetical protein
MRGTMRRRILTEEEKAAKKLSAIVSDVRLDLDEVGMYLGRYAPTVSYNRLMLIAESAEFEKENIDVRNSHEPLF